MATTPRFKVYDAEGEYAGAMKNLFDALCAIYGREGWSVRDGHSKARTVFIETGDGEASTAESVDAATELAYDNLEKLTATNAKAAAFSLRSAQQPTQPTLFCQRVEQ